MQLRLKHQTSNLSENKPADNLINPAQLTQIEEKTLKNAFSLISGIQKKLSYDFTGDAL